MAVCNVISHRGANKVTPQNTIEAFKKAIQFRADGFETDVHLTSDGVPVICHNYTIDKTSDGKGAIASNTLDYLKRFDFGSYFHHSYKGVEIPTLEEFLTLSKKANLKVLNIEIKSPRNKDYIIVDKILDAVKAHGLFDKLLISSFDPDLLVYIKDKDENCKTGFLYSPDKPITYKRVLGNEIGFAKSIDADALHPHQMFVTQKLIDEAHENGIMVNPWTVNKEKDIIKLVKMGVDGVITDVPNIAKRLIEAL
ncbi:MAG: glycerophosphodiester phosphodiesterase family protein [Acutalibacteraceae bacterium]|nr:glycerophosphodiester phosphodiesterase family protein [Acutalibacteraceae bacterium]